MNPEQEREIRQLFFAASHLMADLDKRFASADAVVKALMEKEMSYFANLFAAKESVVNETDKICVIFGADLASAAVRLVTIEERLRSGGQLTAYGAFQDLVGAVKGDQNFPLLRDAFDRQLDTILHILLRDNVGHVEPANQGSPIWWRARQDVLSRLSLEALYAKLCEIRKRMAKQLQDFGIL